MSDTYLRKNKKRNRRGHERILNHLYDELKNMEVEFENDVTEETRSGILSKPYRRRR